MNRTFLLALAMFAAMFALPASGSAAPTLAPIGTFTSPMYVTAPPGDTARIFVVERAGLIKVVRDGTTLATPFLNISTMVSTTSERGLQSMAFAPDYATSGKFWLFYTDLGGDVQIDQYTTTTPAGDTATSPVRTPVLTIEHSSAGNHNGGQLQFGPDGMLYASVGDAANGANAQDLTGDLGKLLRINPQTFIGAADNPFVGTPGARSEIWSLGLRNPYRFSFDRTTGALLLSDVGEGSREEVNFAAAPNGGKGLNFGWPNAEGTIGGCAGCTPPQFEYPHTVGACAITGGYVVRDAQLPTLVGRYLYGDFCVGDLRSVVIGAGGASGDVSLGINAGQLNSFGEDACGRIYVVQLGGAVSRLQDGASSCPAPIAPPPPPGGETDTTPPAVTTPTTGLALRSAAALNRAPVRVAWTASDAAGIASVQLQVISTGGTWRTIAVNAASRSTIAPLTYNKRHVFRVRAVDPSGNASPWRLSSGVVPRIFDLPARNCTRGWRSIKAFGTYGGSYLATRTAGANCNVTVRARSVALIGPTLTTSGRVRVTIGRTIALGNMFARPRVTRMLLAGRTFSSSAYRRVDVRASRGTVTSDAVVWLA